MNDNNNAGSNYNYSSPYPPYPPYPPPAPAKTNGKAIAALVLGICAILLPYIGFIIGIVAIIIAAISLKEIARKQEQGKGLAIAGLVCGIIGTSIYTILLLIIVIALVSFGSMSDNYYYDVASSLLSSTHV